MGELFQPYAFAIGMVALVNPCGFALLPAYLGYFLGLDDDAGESRIVALNRAQMVGLSLSLGFLFVFGLLGVVFAGFYSSIQGALPYVTMVIGAGLIALGIAMLRGFDLTLKIPKLDKGTGSRSVGSMFVFGVSYAIASLSCTIGLFLGVVGTSSSGRGFNERLGGFLSYGLGMGLLATTLTLAVAFGKRGLVNRFRQLLPKINLISAVVLVIVGVYVGIYGWWSLSVPFLEEPTGLAGIGNDIVTTAERWQGSFATWINNRSTVLGWGFVGINAVLIVAGLAARRGGGEDTSTQPVQV